MKKSLEEMSTQELGRLFPIELQTYNPNWKQEYRTEKNQLELIIGEENVVRINHIGSTSVPGALAKPTIDILVEIREQTDIDNLIQNMKQAGYYYSPQPDNPPPHLMFQKGYTQDGYKGQSFHIHIRYSGDWDELYFRDYLCDHPDVLTEYADLKSRLQKEYRNFRDEYTQAKTSFVQGINKRARADLNYIDRYKPGQEEK